MKVTVLLADKGTPNAQQGTLNLLNVGWSQTSLRPAGAMFPGGFLTPPFAVAIFYEVDPRHCNHQIELVLELLNEDGHPVQIPGPTGPQDMKITQQMTVPSPAGMPMGSPGRGNSLIEIMPGLALAPGGYEWRASLAAEHDENWSAHFRVLAPPTAPVVGFGTPAATGSA